MTTSHFDFGARLIEIQTDAGVSSSELARRLSVARQQVGQWRAARDARISTVFKVCDAIGVSHEEFLSGSD